MAFSRLIRRRTRTALALAACVGILLAFASAALAHTADTPVRVVHNTPAPTIVRETVLQPNDGGPDAIVLVLIGIGTAAALLGAGYLGARIATRTNYVRPS
jgi:hypothetical protein